MRKGIKFRTFAGILAWIIAMGTFPPAVSGAEEIETEPTSEIEEIYEEAEPVEAEFFWDEPVETEPEETESEVIEPEETESEEIEPEETESEVIEPEETESEVIEPEETESEVIEPEETESEVIEPEETESEEIEPEEETQPEVIPEVTLYEQLLLSETLTAMYELLTAEENAETLALLTEEEITELIAKADDLYNTVFAIDPMNAELALSAEIISVLNGLPNAPVAVTEEIPVEIVNVQEKMAEFATAVALFPNEADFILYDEENDAEIFDEEAYYAAYAAFYEENPDIWMTTDALFAEAEAAYAEENPDGDIDAWMQDNGFWEAAEKFYWVVPTPDAVAEKSAQMEEVELEFTAEEETPVFDSVKNALYEYRFKMYAYDENVYAQDDVVETYEADGITPEAFLNVYVEWTTLTAEEIDALTVSVVELYDETYDQMVEYALERYGEEELYKLRAYEVNFLLNGEPVDMTANPMTMEVELLNYERESMTFAMAEEEEPAPEAEVGTILSTLTLDETGAPVEVGSVFVEEGAEEETATLMSFMATSSNVVVYANSKTANPSFTVQYYANLDVLSETGDENRNVSVIDTSDGKLPKNTEKYRSKLLYIDEDNKIKSDKKEVEIYSSKQYEYIYAPNLSYFNRLYENDNYKISNVRVSDDGGTTFIDYSPDAVHFTNNRDAADDNTVYLDANNPSIVIRLVFEPTPALYKNPASFYDYDISDGVHYKAQTGDETVSVEKNDTSTVVYMSTKEQGINSPENYDDSNAAKLAFGNNNSGTGLDTEQWKYDQSLLNRGNYCEQKDANGSNINQYTTNGETKNDLSTYGLVKGLNTDGTLDYSDGLTVPDLFNENTPDYNKDTAPNGVRGKTTYNNYQLEFQREGDTYILKSVYDAAGKPKAENLNQLTHHKDSNGKDKYPHIWTNHFWPMDDVASHGTAEHDAFIGGHSDGTRKRREDSGGLPRSDDGTHHNFFFGMHYTVDFTLSPDYIGPLEYYFFGDDDMWVLLSEKGEEKDAELICDIGGVHLSIGEYVNLWDYIDKEGREEDITYTLHFFYAERGASGSTCYMQFTLPSVSCEEPKRGVGVLKIEKDVQSVLNTNIDKDVDFTIEFTDEEGNYLKDEYCYEKYSSNHDLIDQNIIIKTGDTFTLMDGQYIIIRYLPLGTKYYIKETTEWDGFTTSIKHTSPTAINGEIVGSTTSEFPDMNEIEGEIKTESLSTYESVLFINKHNVVIDTAVHLDYLPYIILFSIVGTGVILASADHRRKADEVDD